MTKIRIERNIEDLGYLIPKVQGRLTLASGTPITTTNQSSKSTLYYTPFSGNNISVYYDGIWHLLQFSEKNLGIGDFTASKSHDIFGYYNSGDLGIEPLVWTSATARATELTTQDGVYVKSGDATRLYLGTIYANSTPYFNDTLTAGFVWNNYKRVNRKLYMAYGAAHAYTTSTWRYWNNVSTNHMDNVIGLIEEPMNMYVSCECEGAGYESGLAINSVNPNTLQSARTKTYDGVNTFHAGHSVSYPSTVGYNYYAMCESGASGANAWSIYVWIEYKG